MVAVEEDVSVGDEGRIEGGIKQEMENAIQTTEGAKGICECSMFDLQLGRR